MRLHRKGRSLQLATKEPRSREGRSSSPGPPKRPGHSFGKTTSARPLLITPGRENSVRLRVGGKETEAEDVFNRLTPSLRATHRHLALNQQLASPGPRLRAAPLTAPLPPPRPLLQGTWRPCLQAECHIAFKTTVGHVLCGRYFLGVGDK